MEQKKIEEALSLDIFFQSLLQYSDPANETNEDDDLEDLFAQESSKSTKTFFHHYNLDESRQWMKDLMLEDNSDSDSGEDISELLKIHKQVQFYRAQVRLDPSLTKYMYYSSDLITGDNKWPDHFQSVKKKCLKRKGQLNKLGKVKRALGSGLSNTDSVNAGFSSRSFQHRGKLHTVSDKISHGNLVKKRALSLSRKRSMNMAALRRYIWKIIVKKEIPKAYRLHVQNQTNKLTLLKKASKEATKKVRAKALESRMRSKKEVVIARARRMTREAQVFWKKYIREEKTQRRHAEKQAETQRKIEDELREAQKHELKLKFLITQTELYAKFVSGETPEPEILTESPSEETSLTEVNVTDSSDHEEVEFSEKRAYQTANNAFLLHQSKMKMYSNAKKLLKQKENNPSELDTGTVQPKLLRGQLTGYQLKGVSWLFNLYRHGLNGILADDMGLGKTIQTIAFLAGLAETHGVWGPFLVIAPASTLNNWHQEFSRFLPDFKILPYWGTTSERKILRLFWNQKSDEKPTSEYPFHVLITSYQLATTDMRYFQKIPWHYIVLDEAHALKSSSSIRWKTLLDFNCRNRLLLTGTPVQNTMAELWALLHFIMPTLFDNHVEFNEWFAKNIESYADSKASIDESDLSRLHRILKPFILRRLKCDVEHELTEKIEVRVLCQLSPRQKILYDGLQKNILVKELIRARSSTGQSSNNIMLMNLVMQFRKVCNHPNIFHCREICSPFHWRPCTLNIPRLIFDSFLSTTSEKQNNTKLFYSDFNIHVPSNTSRFVEGFHSDSSVFSFLRLIGASPSEYWKVFSGNLRDRFHFLKALDRRKNREIHSCLFACRDLFMPSHITTRRYANPLDSFQSNSQSTLPFYSPNLTDFYNHFTPSESILFRLFFTRSTHNFFSHLNHTVTCLSSDDRMVSRQSPKKESSPENKKSSASLARHRVVSGVRPNVATEISTCFSNIYMPKVCCSDREVYCDDISALNYLKLIRCCLKENIVTTFLPHSTVVRVPDRELLVTDSGKLQALDILLHRLKDGGHRVLVYSQMTKMIDILEEYMLMRSHSYVRLDGSCRISSRRDTVAGFQSSEDIFVFLLSTRAGGLGINLTAADTVIFYDSDWNPTVDQQAMDRTHRLGQTKQVTVYRLVCKGTVDERILARAETKSTIQRMVIQDGGFKSDPLNQNEMVSLLLDDDQIARASQTDTALKTSLEKAKTPSTTRRKYRRRTSQSSVKRKKGSGSKSSERILKDSSPEENETTLNPLLSTQTVNVSKARVSGGSSEDQEVVVDDERSSDVSTSNAPTELRGHKRRGRPRLRPSAPSTKPRPAVREAVQRRWQSTSQRGRGGRGRRRGRAFSGRVAALAGARAGALAATAAALQSKRTGYSPSGT